MLSCLLAVLAACANATSSVLQHNANREVPRSENLSWRLVRSLLHEPVWFAGILAIIVGFLLQAAALGSGQLATVEPVLVLELPATMIVASRAFGSRLRRREWASIAVMTVSLAELLEADTAGDPSQAGFVQVMQGRSSDPDRARELMANDPTDWREFRPDILGTVSAGHDGGAWTMALYFTSEESAREGERKEPPPQMQEMMKEMDALTIGEPVLFDFRDPWLHAPG